MFNFQFVHELNRINIILFGNVLHLHYISWILVQFKWMLWSHTHFNMRQIHINGIISKSIWCEYFSYIPSNWSKWKSMAKLDLLNWSQIFRKNTCRWMNFKKFFTWFWWMFVRSLNNFHFSKCLFVAFHRYTKETFKQKCTLICDVVWCCGVMRFSVPTYSTNQMNAFRS